MRLSAKLNMQNPPPPRRTILMFPDELINPRGAVRDASAAAKGVYTPLAAATCIGTPENAKAIAAEPFWGHGF